MQRLAVVANSSRVHRVFPDDLFGDEDSSPVLYMARDGSL